MHWESQFYWKRIKEYRGASSSEDSLDTSANDLADSCPNANRSWHHFGMTQHIPTWPNYPLRLPLATLQLVRLKTSPASKVTSNRCLTWTNTQLSCKSCTCNLVICTSQVASMTLPASWHALQSFSVVLGSPVRIAAKQPNRYIYIEVGSTREQNRSQETQKVERLSISSILVCIYRKILVNVLIYAYMYTYIFLYTYWLYVYWQLV